MGRNAGCCLALGAMLLLGCGAPRNIEMEVDPDQLTDMEFQAYLATAPMVTVAEAYRAMLMLADGEDTCKSFDERRERLAARGIIRPQWNLRPDHVLDQGSLAYMVMRICRMPGGVNMLALGSFGIGDRRYALREMIYRGMMEDAVAYQFVSGGQLVALMAQADVYMEKHALYEAPPIELPPEPKPGEKAY